MTDRLTKDLQDALNLADQDFADELRGDDPPRWKFLLVWTVLSLGCVCVCIGIVWALWKTVGAG